MFAILSHFVEKRERKLEEGILRKKFRNSFFSNPFDFLTPLFCLFTDLRV